MGSDSYLGYGEPEVQAFQSTLPHGERPVILEMASDTGVSIHAPTWGATSDTN